KYLAYIQINDVQLTTSRKHVKRKHLIEINNFLKNKKDLSSLKAPNQINIPILHLFYKFSLKCNILNINKNILSPSYNFAQYLNLGEEERLALFIEYIWESSSWIDKEKYVLVSILNQLEPNYLYPIDRYLDSYINNEYSIKNFTDFFE